MINQSQHISTKPITPRIPNSANGNLGKKNRQILGTLCLLRQSPRHCSRTRALPKQSTAIAIILAQKTPAEKGCSSLNRASHRKTYIRSIVPACTRVRVDKAPRTGARARATNSCECVGGKNEGIHTKSEST